MSAPAIVGAGGCAMPPCPMRCVGNWKVLWKRMNCITLLATKAKHHKAGRSRWGAGRVVVVRSSSLAVASMTKTGPPMIAWVSRQGLVVVHAVKDCTVKTVQKAADLAVQAGSRL